MNEVEPRLDLDRHVLSYKPDEVPEFYAAYCNYLNGSDEFNVAYQVYRFRKSRSCSLSVLAGFT